ncbi:MAG: class I SAM-dependent methyltransferase [Verrucomicrobia bacterium]|jgi:SAM-dependent methyltransferase|nr:class I SAM-dependent methyltransferase [Verrucomicrobiota bacterium]
MGHQETYHHNEAYAEFLAGWDVSFYQKYIDTLVPDSVELPVLDVGCGVGQVVAALSQKGVMAHGVDVSHPNIEQAQKHSALCKIYDGKRLPYKAGEFGVVGAFNVLEHVDEPEQFLQEMVRVTRPGGKVVVSSPNFFRVLGLRDYHPRMRGLGNKFSNFGRLLQKRKTLKGPPEHWRFDRMEPINKEPFTPDDDAIIATNPLEIKAFLRQTGCCIESVACTDRHVHPLVNFFLNLSLWKYGMFNGFVVARRP